MDPKATLIEALEWMLEMQRRPESEYPRFGAADRLRDLADWLEDGGFGPNLAGAEWDWPRE